MAEFHEKQPQNAGIPKDTEGRMRKIRHNQIPLTPTDIDHSHAKELGAISDTLDANPMIEELAMQDLVPEGTSSTTGAPGMSAENAGRIEGRIACRERMGGTLKYYYREAA